MPLDLFLSLNTKNIICMQSTAFQGCYVTFSCLGNNEDVTISADTFYTFYKRLPTSVTVYGGESGESTGIVHFDDSSLRTLADLWEVSRTILPSRTVGSVKSVSLDWFDNDVQLGVFWFTIDSTLGLTVSADLQGEDYSYESDTVFTFNYN